jgi:hypothetical protein
MTDFEHTRRRAAIALLLPKTWLILSGKPCAPGESVFAKQHRERSSHRNPISAMRSLK